MSGEEPRGGFALRRLLRLALLAALTGVGLLAAVAVAIDWLQAVDTHLWQETTCTVVSSRAVDRPGGEGYALEVSYRYRHGGTAYSSDAYRHGGALFDEVADAQREAARFPAGAELPCWVDPDDPARSYLRRADLWRGLWILAPLTFVAIGGGLLWLLHGPAQKRSAGGGPGRSTVAEKLAAIKPAALLIGFFAIFLLFGVGVLVPFFVRPALQVVEARSWRPVPCEVISSGVRTHPGEDGATYSVEVLYRYRIAGREHLSSRYRFMGGSSSGYEAKAETVRGMPAGTRLTCWVNPDDPYDAVVDRGLSSDYLFGLVPLLFALVGLGGIAFTVGTMRAMKRDAARSSWLPVAPGGSGEATGRLEAAPSGPVVLEPRMGRLGKLGVAILVALLWNGILALFVWHVAESWRAGNPEWLLTLFLVPFVLVGLLLIAAIPYGILALANPRPRLRLAPGAIRAGDSAEVLWTFRGAAGRIRRLRIWLEATRTTTEVEVHDSGGSIRRSSQPAGEVEILDRDADTPIEFGAATFSLPEDAPPTSEGEEAISWKLGLHGEIDHWPDVSEEYEVRVLPAENGRW